MQQLTYCSFLIDLIVKKQVNDKYKIINYVIKIRSLTFHKASDFATMQVCNRIEF